MAAQYVPGTQGIGPFRNPETYSKAITPANSLGGVDYNFAGEVIGPTPQRKSRDVQGISTSNNSQPQSTSSGGAGSFPADQYIGWDPAAAQADWEAKGGQSGQGGGGGGPSLDDLYSGEISALDRLLGQLAESKQEFVGNVEQDYEAGVEKVGREGEELQQSLDEQARRLAEGARSAYGQATRDYNQLVQQGLSRFGMGSSAGQAVSELVNQEFLRGRNRMRQQEIQGEQQIAQEQTRLANYLQDKESELDSWKRNAIAQINQNFQTQMSQVELDKVKTEQQKTRDKLAVLQEATNQARNIQNQEREFKLGLAQFTIEQMQQVEGRTFTPEEIASVTNRVMNQEIAGFGQRAGGMGPGNQQMIRPPGVNEDDWRELTGVV